MQSNPRPVRQLCSVVPLTGRGCHAGGVREGRIKGAPPVPRAAGRGWGGVGACAAWFPPPPPRAAPRPRGFGGRPRAPPRHPDDRPPRGSPPRSPAPCPGPCVGGYVRARPPFPPPSRLQVPLSPPLPTPHHFPPTHPYPPPLPGLATKPGVDPALGAQTCTINVTFTPTSTGPLPGTLSTGSGGPTAALSGNGVTFPTPPTPPTPGPALPTLAFDLDAKKQKLRKALTFFATTNVDSTPGVGGSVKRITRGLAAGEKTKVTAKPKKSTRENLEDKLAASGKAKAKVEALATDQFGNADIQEITVKLKGLRLKPTRPGGRRFQRLSAKSGVRASPSFTVLTARWGRRRSGCRSPSA